MCICWELKALLSSMKRCRPIILYNSAVLSNHGKMLRDFVGFKWVKKLRYILILSRWTDAAFFLLWLDHEWNVCFQTEIYPRQRATAFFPFPFSVVMIPLRNVLGTLLQLLPYGPKPKPKYSALWTGMPYGHDKVWTWQYSFCNGDFSKSSRNWKGFRIH